MKDLTYKELAFT
ncbi:hypothetical protein PENPOL_c039G04905 [Penicillium polonicum]|uniref:Uncharacterized protein n=1 Tax=Penicillium polonicum TaxID=60169 RepID=A0A1V6N5K2_PENPO|nr:hypothetical protein PENPOL_c039G04905 [Penicillium polonicum]